MSATDGQHPTPWADALPLSGWLDQMLEGFVAYEAVRENGTVVDFRRVYVNAAAVRLLKHAEVGEEALLSRLRPGAWATGIFAAYVQVLESGQPWEVRAFPYGDDDVEGAFDMRAWRLTGADGIAVTWRDVTQEAEAAARLRASEERFRATVEQLPDSVAVLDSVRDDSGTIVDFAWSYCNETNARMCAYTVEELIGKRLLEVFPEQREAGLFEAYAWVVESGEPYEQPTVWYEDTWGDGQRRRMAFDVRASKVGDGFVVVTRDVTELRLATEDLREANASIAELNAFLQERVRRDPLTDLYNRRFLEDRLRQDLSAGGVSVLQLDIDHFKQVNDTYGHDVGDRVLVGVADALRATFRDEDTACRYGGEEFTVILPGCSAEIALQRAADLRLNLTGQRRVGDGFAMPTLSVGVATSEPGETGVSLLHRADQALLTAKRQGRDRVQVALPRPRDPS